MMRLVMAVAACLLLTSCVAALEAGGIEALGAAEMGAGEAALASRLMIAPEVAGESGLAASMGELAAGRTMLLVDETGVVHAGSRGIASLEGTTFYAREGPIARLQDGYLYRVDSSQLLGRFRGSIPRQGVTLSFTNGPEVASLRPMMVDVLEMNGGRYLIRLADGSTAWVAGPLALAVLAATGKEDCDPARGAGLLVRPSGEPIAFDQCERQDDMLILATADGPIYVAADEAQDLSYGSGALQFAQASQAQLSTS